MKIFTRVAATLSATASETVALFENHEAVSDAALERSRRALADARLAGRRQARERETLQGRIDSTENEIADWTRRAQETSANDERTALACLAKRHEERARLDTLRARIHAHDEDATHLAERVADLERRHDELAQQARRLSSRAAVAKAETVMARVAPDERLQDVLDRWEASVDADELRAGRQATPRATREGFTGRSKTSDRDALGVRFEREEHERALRDELEALRSGSDNAAELTTDISGGGGADQ